ncbi:MAG: glycosyl transferase [Flavobacterium sp.]|nr:MAG: glycosyl transferase [Flavobacterium sp.]
MSKLISIITPSFNSEKYISETIKSVQNQSYSNWELLIVDDASTDTTCLIAERYSKKDTRIQLTKNATNKGAAFCRNLATKLAKGTYIAFLDSDDLWHSNKLEKQINFMNKHQNGVSYTNYLHIDEEGNALAKRIKAMPSLSYKKQLKNNYIGNLTGIYNAEVLGKITAPNLRKRQDWAVWLEAIKCNKKPAIGLQEDLAFYRVHKKSMSSNKTSLLKYNYWFYNKHLGYSKIVSVFYLVQFLWEYFFVRPKYIQKL